MVTLFAMDYQGITNCRGISSQQQPLAFMPATLSAGRTDDPYHTPTVNEAMLDYYEQHKRPVYYIYQPNSISIVVGAGRKNKDDLLTEKIAHDAIPVFDRKGGGGTVVLSPGMAVLAVVTEVIDFFKNKGYAREINSWFKETLIDLGVKDPEDRGIADLAINEKKILGCSLYRRKHLLFYQASLLINNDLALFDKYLTIPSLVPDYRGKRHHLEFCTTLASQGYRLTVEQIMEKLQTVVLRRLPLFH